MSRWFIILLVIWLPAARLCAEATPAPADTPNAPATPGSAPPPPAPPPATGAIGVPPPENMGYTDVTEEFPELRKYLFIEPKSHFDFGFGMNPIGVMKSKLFFSLDIFELHWLSDPWDIEVFGATLGLGFANTALGSSRHLTFRTSPKLKILSFLSVGPILGYEFVSFPNAGSKLNQGIFVTPDEPFSSNGLIYGLAFSETFEFEKSAYKLKVTQSVYQETYSTTKTKDGWNYVFDDLTLQNDPSHAAIAPSVVFMLQLSLLY